MNAIFLKKKSCYLQVITARHCDIKAFAFSIITNKCVFEYDSMEEPGHEEVVQASKNRQSVVAEFVCRIIGRVAADAVNGKKK